MKRLWIGLLAIFLAGCSRTGQPTPTVDLAAPSPLAPSSAPLPATFTPPPPLLPLPTFTPAPSLTPLPSATPIDFDQTAVELRSTIPAIGLDRRASWRSFILREHQTSPSWREINRPYCLGVRRELAIAISLPTSNLPEHGNVTGIMGGSSQLDQSS